jgi:hypothetical protein
LAFCFVPILCALALRDLWLCKLLCKAVFAASITIAIGRLALFRGAFYRLKNWASSMPSTAGAPQITVSDSPAARVITWSA